MTTTSDFEPSCVLCALDFEQPVSGLLDTAISIAQRFDATLHLVHVWLPAVALTPEGGMVPATSDLDAVAATLGEQLEGVAATVRRRHPRVATKLLSGTAWREIVGYAEAHDCDLIVAGTHGRTGISRIVEGSVAERIVRAASVPVLIVPVHHADDAARGKKPPIEEREQEEPCSMEA
jgi:nucleotide-binding universal stress UspA family protein